MLSWFRCGKKGYGLQVLEDISEGQFLIEYVGEVIYCCCICKIGGCGGFVLLSKPSGLS